jgi:hypothetical protein
MVEINNTTTEVGEGVEPVDTYEESLDAGYFGLKKDPLPNEVYTVSGSVARSDELFKTPEDQNASLPRRGPGRPRKVDTGERQERKE